MTYRTWASYAKISIKEAGGMVALEGTCPQDQSIPEYAHFVHADSCLFAALMRAVAHIPALSNSVMKW